MYIFSYFERKKLKKTNFIWIRLIISFLNFYLHIYCYSILNFLSECTILNFYIFSDYFSCSFYQISPDGKGSPVASAQFPGPLSSVSYPYFDDVIDTRYTVIGDWQCYTICSIKLLLMSHYFFICLFSKCINFIFLQRFNYYQINRFPIKKLICLHFSILFISWHDDQALVLCSFFFFVDSIRTF